MNTSNILRFAVGSIGVAVLGAITLPVSTWMFGAADIGRITMLQTVTNLSIVLFGLGLDHGYVREYHHVHNREALFRLASRPGLLLILLAGAALLAVAPEKLAFLIFGSGSIGLACAAVVTVLAAYCSRYFSLILRMEERGFAFSMSQLAPKLIFLSMLLMLYVEGSARSFTWLISSHVLGVVAAALIFAWNTQHVWLRNLGSVVDGGCSLPGLLRYGAPLMVAGLAFWGLEAIDRVMLRFLSDFGELGKYSVAGGIASVASTLSVLFSTVWLPTAYRWINEPDCQERVEDVARKLVAIGGILISMAGAFAWVLRFVLPPEYTTVQYLVCVCMVPPVLYATTDVTGIGAGIARKSMVVMFGTIVASTLNVAGNWVLIPALGARGAAISTAVAYFLLFVLRTETSIRYWAPMRRAPLYMPMSIITAAAILFALGGPRYPTTASVVWTGFVLILISLYRKTVWSLLVNFRAIKQPA